MFYSLNDVFPPGARHEKAARSRAPVKICNLARAEIDKPDGPIQKQTQRGSVSVHSLVQHCIEPA